MADGSKAVAMALVRQDASAVDRQGSTVTFASCKWCKHCGGTKKMDPRESKTAEWIRCKAADGLDLVEKEWKTTQRGTSQEVEAGPEYENRNVAVIKKIDGLIGLAPVRGTPPQQLHRRPYSPT
eukprot:jgi/Pico_ML_1/53847/g4319.t1